MNTSNLAPMSATDERGSALVAVTVALVGLSAVSLAVLQIGMSARGEQRASVERLNAQYASEAAMVAALADLTDGGTGLVFTPQAPLVLGGAEAFVTVTDLGGGDTGLATSSSSGLSSFGVEVVMDMVTQSLFQFGAFGDESLSLDSNAIVDSYDSTSGAYAAVNGSGSDAYANSNGTIGSNGDVELAQNATVWGDAQCGPGQSTTVLGNAVVSGSTTPAATTMELPEITMPTTTYAGNVAISSNSSGTVPSGDWEYDDLGVGKNANLTIVGPAKLVVGNFEIASGSEIWIDDTNGPVEIYVQEDFIVHSNTMVASLDYEPADLAFQLLSDNIIAPDDILIDPDYVDFDSNAQIYGSIYAPNASIEINSNFELFGAIVAKQLHLDSNCKIHYDEALADADSNKIITWQPVGYMVTGAQK